MSNRTVLRRTVRLAKRQPKPPPPPPPRRQPCDEDENDVNARRRRGGDLRLAMLGCEDNPPYGPDVSIARLFLEVLCAAMERRRRPSRPGDDTGDVEETVDAGGRRAEENGAAAEEETTTVSIALYRAKLEDYPSTPQEWDSYDGFLLPGSFSSAYDDDPWIETLKGIVRNELHGKRRRVLGVCFGHQVYAHSFRGESDARGGGRAVPCPAGTQAGRRSFRPTAAGRALLLSNSVSPCIPRLGDDEEEDKDGVQLLYTHGDMVGSLPPFAESLGGNASVPIQAVAYFGSIDEADRYRSSLERRREGRVGDCSADENKDSEGGGGADDRGKSMSSHLVPSPIAITFQAHPEYACPMGLRDTFADVLSVLGKRRSISVTEADEAGKDAARCFDAVEEDSLRMVTAVASAFGWF